jgi:hypothetical protein
MKRILIALGLVLALVIPVNAELQGQTVSAVDVSQTITIGYSTLTVVNDGANEVYVRVFWEGETSAAATTSSREIKSGEGFTFSKGLQISAISIVCASGETATVRLFYW